MRQCTVGSHRETAPALRYPERVSEEALWKYVRELHAAVEKGNRGDAPQPYHKGPFLVSARAGDIEVTIKDIAEEDAILIAGELGAYGVHTVIRSSTTCPHCGERVPMQRYCTSCRERLRPASDEPFPDSFPNHEE